MTTHKRQFLLWLAVALVVAALTAPAVQAGGPDDRPFARGSTAASQPRIVSPDDRPVVRGSSVLSQPSVVSPDDRSYARTEFAAKAVPVSVTQRASNGFDWQAAAIGVGFGMLAAGLVLGALLFRHERRSSLKPA